MSGFERLHAAIQHHVVNTLGWPGLRPLQAQAVDPILDGDHALLLAPTAGGKTEAALLPTLSRMLSEDWQGLSVLYICPIKALLNNLEPRIRGYAELLGRRVGLWHGDVGSGERGRILRDPPDLLLTTPESIEVILTSARTDHRAFFANLRCLIVDELHAFAGDDRGWHLLCITERLMRVANRDIQRLGLSATIGNPAELLDWLAGSSEGQRRIVAPEIGTSSAGAHAEADVTLDYVGGIENAATVISRLYRGEKRLVFCDSRSRVEQLAHRLRALGVNTFVSHSSLSVAERNQAETAFSTARDAVIVATSTLELGLDVGDLDRVIQIDSPTTVASFLQRLGRTGRRSGTSRNCLFLTTNRSAFLQAAALLGLWARGFVEPVTPPPSPYHIVAQQIMALALQERGIGRHTWKNWIGRLPVIREMSEESEAILSHMLKMSILLDDEGIVGFGPEGERTFGRRNFMEILSVFTSEPLFEVQHGRNALGQVHPMTFTTAKAGQPVLLLAGRPWRVTYVDWRSRIAYVEPSDERGRSRWIGAPRALSTEVCSSVRRVLAGEAPPVSMTKRAVVELDDARDAFTWVEEGETAVVRDVEGSLTWWTFAGLYANQALVGGLRNTVGVSGNADNFSVPVASGTPPAQFDETLAELDGQRLMEEVNIDDEVLEGLKFSACLPQELAIREVRCRMECAEAVSVCLGEPVRWITV